jgi:hypothetical protein
VVLSLVGAFVGFDPPLGGLFVALAVPVVVYRDGVHSAKPWLDSVSKRYATT